MEKSGQRQGYRTKTPIEELMMKKKGKSDIPTGAKTWKETRNSVRLNKKTRP